MDNNCSITTRIRQDRLMIKMALLLEKLGVLDGLF
jgi:hypothetical protein